MMPRRQATVKRATRRIYRRDRRRGPLAQWRAEELARLAATEAEFRATQPLWD